MNPWIRLRSGKKFHLLNPHPREFDINDISHALSQLCRFTGQTSKFYSIAQHCCIVSDMLPDEFKLEGLMHDAPESVLADINSPLKSVLPQYKQVEEKVEKVMAKKYKLKFPFDGAVKDADMIALVSEMKSFMPREDYKNIPFVPLPKLIEAWPMEKAKREFLKRYHRLARK